MILVSVVVIGCTDDGYEVLPLPPVLRNKTIDDIVPAECISVLEEIGFPIYRGTTPPNIEGCYLADNSLLVASNYPNDYDMINNHYFGDYKYRFYSQSSEYRTLAMQSVIKGGSAAGYGSFGNISGTGQNFTAYFIYEETTKSDVATATMKTIFIISGTKTTQGIAHSYHSFIALEKWDPNDVLVPVGTIRVIQETDLLLANTTWGAFKPAGVSKIGDAEVLNYLLKIPATTDALTQMEGK